MSVPVETIIDKLVEFGMLRTNKISGNWYQCYCPIHNDGNEQKPSFGILLQEQMQNGVVYPAGFCHCFACGIAGPIDTIVTKILQNKHISTTGYDWLTQNVPGFTVNRDYEDLVNPELLNLLSTKYAVKTLQSQLTDTNSSYVSEEELQSYRYVVPYMYERKLTDAIIAQFDIGYDANWIPPGRKNAVPCITFPIRDIKGNTLFFCRRSIHGKLYNYPTGVTKPVYGLDQIPKGCKSLVICESCINALTSWVYGIPAVALLGTGNSYQIQQLRELGISEFVLALDGDEAGRRAAQKLKKALNNIALIWVINMPDGKDLNDLTQDEYLTLYNNRE